MAIDHVRVFSGVSPGGPTFDLFFTRWITNFCAPAFVFLAGTSAFFYGRKHGGLSRFFWTRGIWLVFLELTFLRVAWTFNFDFIHYEMAGIIWMIGWCMILMAALIKLPLRAVAVIGILIVAGHNLLDNYIPSLIPTLNNDFGSALWKIFYIGFFAGPVSLGPNGPNLIVLYSIIPWIGVMAVGYAFGKILTLPSTQRNKLCWGIGIGVIVLFLVLRGFNIYGDPRPWAAASNNAGSNGMPGIFQFLNTTKYPASLLFLLMTLGPAIVLIPALEKAKGFLSDKITLFGKVPFFFYMVHIPLIHLLSLVVSFISLGEISGWLFTNHPMGNPSPPDGYTWSILTLYIVWAVVIVILYYLCRWFAVIKSGSNKWWLKYL